MRVAVAPLNKWPGILDQRCEKKMEKNEPHLEAPDEVRELVIFADFE